MRPVWFAISRIWSFAKKPASGEHAGQGERADHERPPSDRHPADQPAHPLQVGFLVHAVHHRAGAQEHQRLVERVGDEHEHRARVEAHPGRHEHEAELAHRGVREDALDVVLGEGAGRREQRRDEPHDQHHRERDPGQPRTAARSGRPGRRPRSPSSRRGSRRRRAWVRPSRREATRAAGPGPTCRSPRRTARSEIAVAVPFVIDRRPSTKHLCEVERPERRTRSARGRSASRVSPIRVVMNAFFAALAFSVFSNQKPISR